MKAIKIITAALAALVLPASAFAAALTTSPSTVSPAVGSTFTVKVAADPQSAKVYTVRANIAFDPAQVQLVSWSFAPKWVALSQGGYDLEDNTNGSLIKTAGYPGGITLPTVLGTATFRAKSAGASSIRITTDSLALDASGKNQISGAQGATQVVVAAAPAPAPAEKAPTAATQPAPKPMANDAEVVTAATTSPEEATTTASTTEAAPIAAAAAAAGSGSIPWWAWALGVIIIAGTGYAWYRRRSAGSL